MYSGKFTMFCPIAVEWCPDTESDNVSGQIAMTITESDNFQFTMFCPCRRLLSVF